MTDPVAPVPAAQSSATGEPWNVGVDEARAAMPSLEGAAALLAAALEHRQELQSEISITQRELIALLQERLDVETGLRGARTDLEHIRRGIAQGRAEHTNQVVEFDRLVRGATAERRTLAAEIEELLRRRDDLIEYEPSVPDTAPKIEVPRTPTRPPVSPRLPSQRTEEFQAAPAPRRLVPPSSEGARLFATLAAIRAHLDALEPTAALRHRRFRRPTLRQLANILIGSVLVALAILLTPVSQVAGGLQLLAVMSGSMEPTIHVGGVVGVRPVPTSDLQVGDVITFATQANPDVLVTHRIVNLETRDGQIMVTTKGDANNTVDAMAAPADHAVGRVDVSLPWLGYLMVWLASPVAKILILVVTVIGFALPSVRRSAEPAVTGQGAEGSESAATSYAALEREIQALLRKPT